MSGVLQGGGVWCVSSVPSDAAGCFPLKHSTAAGQPLRASSLMNGMLGASCWIPQFIIKFSPLEYVLKIEKHTFLMHVLAFM